MDSKSFKSYLQYLIIKGLKPMKRNINVRGQILISESLYKNLKTKGLTGRFKINEEFINNLRLELRRYSDPHQLCRCEPGTFKIRVGRQKPASALNPSSNQMHKFRGGFIFAFEFIRYELTK